ncbi:MAG: DUF2171 domain-containing protein [Vicinamibacteria bacterium]
MNASEIKPDMPVVCGMDADAQFAVVDRVEGDRIKLKRDESGQHHFIPVSAAKRIVDGKLQVDRSAKDVMAAWTTEVYA